MHLILHIRKLHLKNSRWLKSVFPDSKIAEQIPTISNLNYRLSKEEDWKSRLFVVVVIPFQSFI